MAKDPGIGKLITDPNPQRDAIHVAVYPAVAGKRLMPAQTVELFEGRAHPAGIKAIGIVDPFLPLPVEYGQRFWIFLYPGTITTLRHHWEHPSFPDHAVDNAVDRIAQSRKWLDDFASTFNRYPSYTVMGHVYDADPQREPITGEQLLEAMKNGHSITLDNDTPDRAYTWAPEMWKHYEIITGEVVSADRKKDSIFSCSC